jgi:hypothetical protein
MNRPPRSATILLYACVIACLLFVFTGCGAVKDMFQRFTIHADAGDGEELTGVNLRWHPASRTLFVQTTERARVGVWDNESGLYWFYQEFEAGIQFYKSQELDIDGVKQKPGDPLPAALQELPGFWRPGDLELLDLHFE